MGKTTTAKMKIGIYDMYLDALGGGEKYMLSIAAFLSEQHSVDIFWDDDDILRKAAKRFALDLSKIHLTKNIFLSPLSFLEKKKSMESYDLIIYLSDGSIPFLFGKRILSTFNSQPLGLREINYLQK
jgi:fructose-1,6-bisphosphatase